MPSRPRPSATGRSLRPAWAAVALALVAALVLVPGGPSRAATDSVTLVGSLQDELGCPTDWDPACVDTHLTLDGASGVWSGAYDVPAGSYEMKVAINDGWDENYGAGGVADGPNLPLVLEGDGRLTFSYDEATHLLTVSAEVLGDATRADRRRAGTSLRSSLTKERFYFVMADRFANGDTGNDPGGLTGGPPGDRLRPDGQGLLPRRRPRRA